MYFVKYFWIYKIFWNAFKNIHIRDCSWR